MDLEAHFFPPQNILSLLIEAYMVVMKFICVWSFQIDKE